MIYDMIDGMMDFIIESMVDDSLDNAICLMLGYIIDDIYDK